MFEIFLIVCIGVSVGYLLFWETGQTLTREVSESTTIKGPFLGDCRWAAAPNFPLCCNQGKEVTRSNFSKDRIRIAFNPLQSRFDVADASIVKDKAYIPDISEPGS